MGEVGSRVERERIKYRSGYKYQLVEDYITSVAVKPDTYALVPDFILLESSGRLHIKRGYAWDGPSGPTVDTPDSMRGSLVHDALYQLMREGKLDRDKYRKAADEEFLRICLEDGMLPARAHAWYEAVRLFAAGAAKPSKDILTAP